MQTLIAEKLAQAATLVAEADVDVWLTFDRETAEGGDPVLPLILEGGLTWQSALLVSRTRQRVAVVGNYDADPIVASGNWHEVVPYVQSVREPLLNALESLIPTSVSAPKIAVNFSTNDVKADGLSHGMYLLLTEYLRDTRFANALVSAETIVMALRGRKTPTELSRIRAAIMETDRLFEEITAFAKIGRSEREIYDAVQGWIDTRGFGYAWDRAGDPIVNSGPNSMVGHGIPSADISLAPGHIFHIDLGITLEGYSSDIQRCWYVAGEGEQEVPDDVRQAMEAVNGTITAGAAVLRPGISGWEVDAAAREFLVGAGYPEYLHALGHQVGRVAHDGGGILGPRWDRYGRTPYLPVEVGQVYTIELGVNVPGRGYLGIEDMVVVTETGCAWLSHRQTTLPLVRVSK